MILSPPSDTLPPASSDGALGILIWTKCRSFRANIRYQPKNTILNREKRKKGGKGIRRELTCKRVTYLPPLPTRDLLSNPESRGSETVTSSAYINQNNMSKSQKETSTPKHKDEGIQIIVDI